MMADESRTRPAGVDLDLSMIAAEIKELRELASNPDRAEDGWKVYDFSIRWGVLMSGRLKRLEHYYRAGELAKDEEARYQQLRRELGGAMPLIERLGLSRPPVPLED